MSSFSHTATATLLLVLLSMGDPGAASPHYKKTVTLATFNTALAPYRIELGTYSMAKRAAALIQKVG